MFTMLPGVTQEMAASIMNWRLPQTRATIAGGATNEYYLMLPRPYQAKGSSFETIEELLLVKDVTPAILYGQDVNRNGVLDPSEGGSGGAPGDALGIENLMQGSPQLDSRDTGIDHGLYPFVTVFSHEQAGSGTATGLPGVRQAINIKTAPRQVLMCLTALGLTSGDVDTIISNRQPQLSRATSPAPNGSRPFSGSRRRRRPRSARWWLCHRTPARPTLSLWTPRGVGSSGTWRCLTQGPARQRWCTGGT